MENFIVIDIETTGLDSKINSMVSLGAVDFNTGEEFYGECKAEASPLFNNRVAEVDDFALKVNGFTREQCFDVTKIGTIELYNQFVNWSKGRSNVLGGQQVGSFDILFLHEYAGGKSNFEKVFSKRSVDLHSVAFAKFGKSLSLDGVLQALGLSPEPKPHNALNGARLERDAFKSLLS